MTVNGPRRWAGMIVVAVVCGVLAGGTLSAPAAAGSSAVIGGFTGTCALNGTVTGSYTEFQGGGTCHGRLNTGVVVKVGVDAYARAHGITTPQGPVLQQGTGWIRFADGQGTTIGFSFTQVSTTVVFKGNNGGEAVGEVVLHPSVDGGIRRVTVSATTLRPIY